MGHWDYRMVKRSTDDNDKLLDEPVFGIHEAYYKDGEDEPNLITLNPVPPIGNSLEELREVVVDMMGRAIDEPILEWEKFGTQLENESELNTERKPLKGS